MTQLIENVAIWDGRESVIPRGTIHIEETMIARVVPASETADTPRNAVRIDGTGKLAIPGLVNAHTHLYSSLARGMAVTPFAPTTFTEILEQLWWKLDKALDDETVQTSALVGAMEAARCGVTTVIDHHASPNAIPGSLDRLRRAVCDDVGLRGVFCYELTDRDGDERRAQGLKENLRFLSLPDAGDPGHFAAQFGLHASFTVGDEAIGQVAAALPEGAGIHIHVAEGPEDEVECEARYGTRIIERLDRHGLLGPNAILAHCLHINEAEKDLIAERDAIVVHNPRSNMNNAVGLFDMPGFLGRNVLTGLGTDGLGCNMLAELFTAGILQKHGRGNSLAGSFADLDRILFVSNPLIASRLLGVDVGRVEAGAPADIALLDYAPPTPLRADTLLGHLLFGVAVHGLRVTDLFVAGRPILRDGGFVDLDERGIYARAREQASALWNRLG